MASNTVFKTARSSGFHDNDPLAELTRIMGYDARNQPQTSADLDFGIDLEQELLGELESDAFASSAPAYDAPAADVVTGDLDADLDDAFAELFEGDGARAEAPPAVEDYSRPATPTVDSDADLTEARFDETDFYPAFEDEAAGLDNSFDAAPGVAYGAAGEPSYDVQTNVAYDSPDVTYENDAPAFAAAPSAELSLEDELTALLGGSGPAADSDAAWRETQEARFEAPFAPTLDDWNPRDEDEWADGSDHSNLEAASLMEDVDIAGSVPEFDVPHLDAPSASTEAHISHEASASPESYLPSAPASDYVGSDYVDGAGADDLESAIAVFADDEPWASDASGPVGDYASVDEGADYGEDLLSHGNGQGPMTDAAMAAVPAFAPDDVWAADSIDGKLDTLETVGLEASAPDDESYASTEAAWEPELPSADFDAAEVYAAEAAFDPVEPDTAEGTVAEETDMDPFAALAALAAAPPVLKAFSRTNPTAVQSNWDRAIARGNEAPAPVASAAPAHDTPALHLSSPVVSMPARPGYSPANVAFEEPILGGPAGATESVGAPDVDETLGDDDFSELVDALENDHFAPEIDTVDVPDQAVALADELDIPELIQDEPQPRAPYDDLESEFADAFSQLSMSDPAAEWRQPDTADAADEDALDSDYHSELKRLGQAEDDQATHGVAAGITAAGAARSYRGSDIAYDDTSPIDDEAYGAADPFAVTPAYDDSPAEEPVRPARNRGLMVAAIVAGVAIAGGIGAFALSFGGAEGDSGPVLVRADPAPVKVKPETPGGVVVPNQDGKVYDQVAGQPAGAPTQEKLITGAEEPIVSAPVASAPSEGDPLPGVVIPTVKAEDRVMPDDSMMPIAQDAEIVAVAPRKVRTMIVRPDGTLVAREDPAPTASTSAATPLVAAAQPVAALQSATDMPAPVQVPTMAVLPPVAAEPEAAAAAPAPQPVSTPEPVAAAPVAAAPQPVPEARTAEPTAAIPAPAPRPAAAPVEVASAPAASAPAAAAAGGDLWNVQIASQPTREGAQASYEDLARRYGDVLGGKGVNIVQATIPNKGTFWRVRVPAASKSDANILCAKLKTAGGSCFVSK